MCVATEAALFVIICNFDIFISTFLQRFFTPMLDFFNPMSRYISIFYYPMSHFAPNFASDFDGELFDAVNVSWLKLHSANLANCKANLLTDYPWFLQMNCPSFDSPQLNTCQYCTGSYFNYYIVHLFN